MDDLLGHSITYRVAMGPRAGQKVFTLQAIPAEPPQEQKKGVAQAARFSLHAGVGIKADARGKLERLCRYVNRPAVAEERLALTERGKYRLELKTAYRDGTTDLMLETRVDDLGSTAEARVRDRDREVPALRREA
jgi:hypothetical protein